MFQITQQYKLELFKIFFFIGNVNLFYKMCFQHEQYEN